MAKAPGSGDESRYDQLPYFFLYLSVLLVFFSSSLQLDPLDAGTDNGLTFTSPNWPSSVEVSSGSTAADPKLHHYSHQQQQQSQKKQQTKNKNVITKITNKKPKHPAGSFYYPHIERLPSMAKVSLVKVR